MLNNQRVIPSFPLMPLPVCSKDKCPHPLSMISRWFPVDGCEILHQLVYGLSMFMQTDLLPAHKLGWGGVGCDSIRHYCKTWCDATLRIRHYCKTWWEATLRIRHYCKTWCDATLRIRHYCKTWWEATLRIRHYCKTWCDATLRMGWGGVGWGVIAFDLLTATGEAVRSLMRWREKTTLFVRRVLKHKTL